MASLLLPKGLTRQIVAVFVLVALAGIVGVSWAAWQAERHALEQQVGSKLVAVANMKKDRLRSWLDERQADARLIAVNRLNQEHFTELLDGGVSQERKGELANFLRDNLIGLQQSRSGYYEISMTDKDGLVVVGTNRERLGKAALSPAVEKLKISTIDGNFSCDIYLHPDSGRPVMVFGHVIRAIDLNTHEQTSQTIGEVNIVVEMEDTVYKFLGPLAELGESAESLLVRPDRQGALILSPLIFQANAPLNLFVHSNSPISTAAHQLGNSRKESFHSIDYFDQAVLAVYRQIEPIGWGLVVKQTEVEAFAPIYDLANRIARLTILVLLGTVLLAFILARNLTRPIGALARGTQAIARGDLDVSLQAARNDELGALSISFQQMVEALNARDRETERLTDMLRRRANELESAYGDLRRSDQLKDAFIRNITHELRTPIATLAGFIELLMDDVDDLALDQREMLEVVSRQSQLIARLVNNIVALNNVDTEEDERRPLRTVDIVRASLEACRQSMDVSTSAIEPHQFELHCTDEEVEVLGQPGQLARVVDNLLDNAVKFSPVGGLIHVYVNRVQKYGSDGLEVDRQIVSITDMGIGISKENLLRIWDRFFQADNTAIRRFGGTGLGLALVKEIVEAHGGQVWADSVLGEGTTISFSLSVYSHPVSAPLSVEEAPLVPISSI